MRSPRREGREERDERKRCQDRKRWSEVESESESEGEWYYASSNAKLLPTWLNLPCNF
jgi:hypothetical protein